MRSHQRLVASFAKGQSDNRPSSEGLWKSVRGVGGGDVHVHLYQGNGRPRRRLYVFAYVAVPLRSRPSDAAGAAVLMSTVVPASPVRLPRFPSALAHCCANEPGPHIQPSPSVYSVAQQPSAHRQRLGLFATWSQTASRLTVNPAGDRYPHRRHLLPKITKLFSNNAAVHACLWSPIGRDAVRGKFL